MTEGYRQDPAQLLNKALFDEPSIEEGAGGLVLVRDIDFASLSLETLLPFYGRCHVAYVPSNGVVLGLSKLARLTKLCAKQLQTQDSLGRHILHVLQSQLQPQGAVVVVQARHLVYTSAQPPQQQTTAAASGCLAAALSCKAGTAETSLQEVFDLLGVHCDLADVQLLQDPNSLSLATSGRSCTCSSSGFKLFGSSCVSCGSSRLEPSILRGISASAGVGIDQEDALLAPVTPDPSENDDTDSSEQGSVQDADCSYCQQGIAGLGFSSSCRSITEDSELEGSDSMESAMQLLLAEAGVDITSAAVQAALRRHVMALLSATSGYLQEHSSRPVSSSSVRHQQDEVLAAGSGCSCCCDYQQQQQRHDREQHCVGDHPHQQQHEEGQYVQYVHSVPFMSQCEHHMLPFHGSAHISYLLPKDTGVSCSCKASQQQQQQRPLTQQEAEELVHCYTKRLQVQERITHQVADAVNRLLQPAGVMVVISAAHMCMVARGVENHAGTTSTRAAFGVYQKDARLRCKFLRSLQLLQ
eukprot:GHUV01034171.1.p1 GENE.GHUV01034171.1~~GHUV01034171.1.p1  ORF type:complete len:526 (+),score=184.54 GHUV01034171.1:871-2448(+)